MNASFLHTVGSSDAQDESRRKMVGANWHVSQKLTKREPCSGSKASVKLETPGQGSHSNAPSVLRMCGKPVLLVEQLGSVQDTQSPVRTDREPRLPEVPERIPRLLAPLLPDYSTSRRPLT
jgi:hypothetical protein